MLVLVGKAKTVAVDVVVDRKTKEEKRQDFMCHAKKKARDISMGGGVKSIANCTVQTHILNQTVGLAAGGGPR